MQPSKPMHPLVCILLIDVSFGIMMSPSIFSTAGSATRSLMLVGALQALRSVEYEKPTQEMLDFCSKYNIACGTEVNEAYERVVNIDVRYRFVIDMKSLDHKD
jgi:D-arabinose 1-dehydrogenase-like Zn-dependent alcohol dehydrogenase